MKGRVLLFDPHTHRGVIEDKNQHRYHFHIGEWLSEQPIFVGKEVNFEIPKEEAINIQAKIKESFLKKILSFIFKIRRDTPRGYPNNQS